MKLSSDSSSRGRFCSWLSSVRVWGLQHGPGGLCGAGAELLLPRSLPAGCGRRQPLRGCAVFCACAGLAPKGGHRWGLVVGWGHHGHPCCTPLPCTWRAERCWACWLGYSGTDASQIRTCGEIWIHAPPVRTPPSAPTHEGPHGWILAPRILRVADPLAPSDCAPHQSPVLAKPRAVGRYSELIIRQMLLRNVSPSASRALAALRRIGSMELASCENLCLFLGGKKSQTLPDLNISAREKL